MELCEVQGLVQRVLEVDSGCSDRVALESALGLLWRLKSCVEGREVLFARLLGEVSSFPEKSLRDEEVSDVLCKRSGPDPNGEHL
jgi:hypothetical protein